MGEGAETLGLKTNELFNERQIRMRKTLFIVVDSRWFGVQSSGSRGDP